MNRISDFIINLQSISHKAYDYSFEIGAEFFTNFEESPVEDGHFKVDITLEKSATMLVVDFKVKGQAQLVCDKSLEPYAEPISFNTRLVFKFGEVFDEVDDDIYIIPHDLDQLNLSTYVFELIAVQIPMRRLHPSLRGAENEEEDEELVYTSESKADNDSEMASDDDIDPRWKALQNLKSNNK